MAMTAKSGSSRFRAATVAVALIGGQMVVPVIAIGSTEGTLPSITPAQPDPAAGSEALAGKILAELGNLPTDAAAEDMEASIIFVLSQENAEAAVVNAALSGLAGNDALSPTLKQAVSNVRLALLKKKVRVGTGSIVGAGGTGASSSDSFLPPPNIGVGGGSADYSS